MSGLLTDLARAWRVLQCHRGISLLILLTLALGLGANAAVFTIGRGVILRPLPYLDPDRLIFVWRGRPAAVHGPSDRGIFTSAEFVALRERQRSFASMAAAEVWTGNVGARLDLAATGGGERLNGAFVSAGFFETLGARAILGRTLADGDPQDVAVISHDVWQRLFAQSPDVISRRIELVTGRAKQRGMRSITVVGVLAPRVQFTYPEATDVWMPLPLNWSGINNGLIYTVIARLRPGVSLAQATDNMMPRASSATVGSDRASAPRSFWLESAHENAVGETRPALLLIGAVAALVFCIACLTAATLLLAQTIERRRDIAVRMALGASRWRIARQLFGETAIMATIAGAASIVVVALLDPVMRAAMPPGTPRAQEIGLDLVTLGWITVLVSLAVVLSALLPAWRSSGADPGDVIGTTGRTATASRGAAMLRHGLIAVQVALVAVLLIGGGLLLRSFWKLQQVDLGFDGHRIFTAEMRLLDPRYFERGAQQAFVSELLSRVRALPGVEIASVTSAVPMRGVDWTVAFSQQGTWVAAKRREVDPDYFGLMRIPLIAGRNFAPSDSETAPAVVVVSQSLAARVFPGRNPIGQRLELDRDHQPEIIGVVGDVHNIRIESDGEPAYYLPRAQQPSELICLVARTTRSVSDLAPAVRAIVASLDPRQPVLQATTVAGIVSDSIADRRFYATATVAFAIITLVLAAAGLYGVTASTTSARTREIGIRVALGASSGRILRMLVAQGVRPAIVGLGLGIVAAFWTTRFLERFLFQIQSSDALTYVAAAAGVVTLTAAACVLPARRATRGNPTDALRHE
jgi:putative ABC transport system permease protein